MYIVRYADDFRIFCRNKEDALRTKEAVTAWITERLRLEVTVIKDGEEVQTEVVLEASDGAYIEILSGIEEGDVISSLPPNLDPRRNS